MARIYRVSWDSAGLLLGFSEEARVLVDNSKILLKILIRSLVEILVISRYFLILLVESYKS